MNTQLLALATACEDETQTIKHIASTFQVSEQFVRALIMFLDIKRTTRTVQTNFVEANNFRQFIDDCLEVDASASIGAKELWLAWVEYATECNWSMKTYSQSKFSSRFWHMQFEKDDRARPRVWLGLRLK